MTTAVIRGNEEIDSSLVVVGQLPSVSINVLATDIVAMPES